MLQQGNINRAVCFGNTDFLAKSADCLRCIPSAADSRNGRHSRIIPAVNHAVVHKSLQISLRHYRIRQVQSRKLNLLRRSAPPANFRKNPVVKRSVVLELECADGMRDSFNCIFNRVREVVHRVNAPLVPCVMVSRMRDTVNNRVSHIDIRRCHVNLRSEHLFAVRVFSFLHFLEKRKIFLYASVSVRTLFARLCKRTPVLLDFLRRKVADIGFALLYQFKRRFVHFVEIIGRPESLIPPETKPFHIFFNGVDVFNILFYRVRVVISEVAGAAVLRRRGKVQADGFRVSDMQVAVRLRRKTRAHLIPVFVTF